MDKEEKIRVIVQGLGVVGSRMVELLASKRSVEIVGAIAHRKEKAGKDLGEVAGLGKKLGVIVSNDADAVFSETVADVVLDCTYSHTSELYPAIVKAVKAKLNYISVGEELSHPWFHAPELAVSIDKLAKKNGVTVMATGVNPGFALDALPIFISGACGVLKKIRMWRCVDVSAFATSSVMVHFGIGLTPEEFKKKEQEGVVVSHVGLPESMSIIADALGWDVEIKETKGPMISKIRRDFSPHFIIEPGQVCGIQHVGQAMKDGQEMMHVEIYGACGFDLKTDGVEAGYTCWLEGEPNIEVKIDGITGAADANTITASRAINAIPFVVNARPGMLRVNEVGLISCLS